MKAVITGVLIAAVIAIAAGLVLDGSVQQTAERRFATEGVRL